MVKVIIALLYVAAKPMAFCLDKLLGHELGTTYSKAEMNKLLEIHVKVRVCKVALNVVYSIFS